MPEIIRHRAPCTVCPPAPANGALVAATSRQLVCRAVHRVLDGALDCGGESDLARSLGLSSRHLRRLFVAELGVTPSQFARTVRAQFARRLIEETDLPITDVSRLSGFGSLRQFERVVRELYACSPRALQRGAAEGGRGLLPGLRIEIPADHQTWSQALARAERRAIPGVELVFDGSYRCAVATGRGAGVICVEQGRTGVQASLYLSSSDELVHIVEQLRTRLFGTSRRSSNLTTAVEGLLAESTGPDDAARACAALAEALGFPVSPPYAEFGPTHAFPSAAALCSADLGSVGITPEQAEEIRALARAEDDRSRNRSRSERERLDATNARADGAKALETSLNEDDWLTGESLAIPFSSMNRLTTAFV